MVTSPTLFGVVSTLALTVATGDAFCVPVSHSPTFGLERQQQRRYSLALSDSSISNESDFPSALPSEDGDDAIYQRLGFAKDEVALGINPSEVLQWLGTREDLVTKFQEDNPQMDREWAEREVTKFMMDAEMVASFVTYQKMKTDPEYIRSMAAEQISDPKTILTYVAWLVGGVGFAYVKNLYIEPKYASGEWEEVHINLGEIWNNMFSQH